MTLTTHSLSYNPLIKNMDLTFTSGQLYGILGPNGSGKSTFLKCLSGIWKPTQGHVLWNGHLLLEQPRNKISQIVSLVPQSPSTIFDFSVEQLVAMGRYPYEKKQPNSSLLDWALNVTDLLHLRNRPLQTLSAGERQRAYIARSLVTEPPILLLDEPTASLDIRHQLDIWQLLKNQVALGKIVIVTVHDLATAIRYCDQLVIFHRGECVAQGPSSQVLSEEVLHSVFGVVASPFSQQVSFSLKLE